MPPTARRRPAFVFLIALLMSFAVGAVQAHAAQAATVSVTPGIDPTRDKSLSISATGTTEVTRTLYTYVFAGARLCAATAAGNDQSGALAFGGTFLSAGAFSRTYTYTPSQTGTYTVCGYVSSSLTDPPAAATTQTFSARAAAASLTIAPSTDPTRDRSMTISVTGTTEVSRTLYTYVFPGSRTCPASAATNDQSAALSFGGSFLSSGPISRTYTYTPTQTGTYTVCSYVAASLTDPPDGVATQTFTVRAATASLTIAPGADPTQDTSLSISIAGTTEVSRTLYSYVFPGTRTCPASPAANDQSAALSFGGSFLSAGAISRTYTYTPSRTGAHTVCAYVAASLTDPPDGSATETFSVRRPSATATVAMPAAATQNASATLTVSGTTEVARTLYVYAQPATPCAPTAAGNAGEAVNIGGSFLSAGSYARTLTWYPRSSGPYRLCAYVASSSVDAPDAAGSLDVTVAADPDAPSPSLGSPFSSGGGGSTAAVPTAVALLGPAAQASAEHLNPTFRWQTSADPDVVDTLRIQRNEPDGTTTKLMDATTSEYTAWEGADGEDTGDGVTGDTSEIATVSETGGVATLQFKDALPPGEYSWFVTRTSRLYPDETDPVRSESRVFVVLGPHLRSLRVSSSSSRGTRSNYPGQTTIDARTTPYARVRFSVRHGKRQSMFSFHTDDTGTASLPLTWSCKRPGGVYRVTVTASDQFGAARHKQVSFRTVSRGRCTQMRRREARARRAREHARAVAERAAERRAARRQAARERRFKNTCSAIGGRPTLIDRGDGMYWYCVGPFGGLLPVPGF